MKLLLDTHTFIWWDGEPDRLSPRALALCQQTENELILSVASLWEIQVKLQLGKIELAIPLPRLVESQRQSNGLQLLPVEAAHVFALDALPAVHKDPFDRMLVAQARADDLRIVTKDAAIKEYPVQVEW